MSDTMDRVIRCVREVCGDVGYLTRETRLWDDLNRDAADALHLVLELEGEFGLVIQEEDDERWKTLGDVADYVDRRLSE